MSKTPFYIIDSPSGFYCVIFIWIFASLSPADTDVWCSIVYLDTHIQPNRIKGPSPKHIRWSQHTRQLFAVLQIDLLIVCYLIHMIVLRKDIGCHSVLSEVDWDTARMGQFGCLPMLWWLQTLAIITMLCCKADYRMCVCIKLNPLACLRFVKMSCFLTDI